LARAIGTNSRNPGSPDGVGPRPRRRPMVPRLRMIRVPTDKSCWTYKYLGNWTGGDFIQDFTCTWFPKHGKGEAKKLWPKKDTDEGCKFWEKRKGSGR